MSIQNKFPIVESVRERDIDLLILEELYSQSGFESLFLDLIDKKDFLFKKAYRSMTISDLGELNMKKPESKPSSSSFVYFSPRWLPKDTRLIHKMEKGYFDLELSGKSIDYEKLVIQYESLLPNNISIVVTGISVSFRIETIPLSFDIEFDEQIYILEQIVSSYKVMESFVVNFFK